jgi:hypothetical protein
LSLDSSGTVAATGGEVKVSLRNGTRVEYDRVGVAEGIGQPPVSFSSLARRSLNGST